MSEAGKILVAAAVLLLCCPAQLFAYIDPGSGSFFLQALVGGVAAVIVIVRSYWRRSVQFVRRRRDGERGPSREV